MDELGRLRPAGAPDLMMAMPAEASGARGRVRWIGPVISLTILAVAANAFRDTDLAAIRAMVPASPLFWLVFAAAYLAQPAADFVIFRRLWTIPAAGFAALVRKLICNEVLLGYSGELYFYTWARRHVPMAGAPFGAVKDVAILSALVGNLVTLVMFGFAWPTLGALDIGLTGRTLFTAIAVLLGSSLVVMLLRGRVFSLPRRELAFVAAVQLFRVAVTTMLAAVMWSLVLPHVAFVYWLMLATLRLLISRLPLLPNKDVVFAGVAVVIVGGTAGIAPLMALMAGLMVVTHVVVGTVIVAADLLGWERSA